MKKDDKKLVIELIGSVAVIAAFAAVILMFGTGEVSMNNSLSLDGLYEDIGNLNTTPSNCEIEYSEKDVFFERFWKTARQNNISTDEIWVDFDVLNEVYLQTKTEYLEHLNICKCTANLVSFWEGEYYGELRGGIPECIFSFLPDMPYNLVQVANPLKEQWDVSVSCKLVGEEYWKQPEFYKRYDTWLNLYSERPIGPTITGYAGYSDESLAIIKAGDSFSSCVFINAQAGMSSFALIPLDTKVMGGSGTSPSFNTNSYSDYTRTTGSEDMSRYFDVKISPETIMIEPVFPMFFANWTQKVQIDVVSSPDTPKGKYMIIVGPFGTASNELNDYLAIEYGTKFINIGGQYYELLKLGVEVR